MSYLTTGLSIFGRPTRVKAWPNNGGSLRIEFIADGGAACTDITLFMGQALGREIYTALVPVLERNGIPHEILENEVK